MKIVVTDDSDKVIYSYGTNKNTKQLCPSREETSAVKKALVEAHYFLGECYGDNQSEEVQPEPFRKDGDI